MLVYTCVHFQSLLNHSRLNIRSSTTAGAKDNFFVIIQCLCIIYIAIILIARAFNLSFGS